MTRPLILLFAVGLVGCGSIKSDTAQNTLPARSNTRSSNSKTAQLPINCGDPDSYQIVQVGEPKHTANDPQYGVNIVSGDKVLRSVDLPSDSEFGNFGAGSNTKTKNGVQIEVDFGTRYYYDLRFMFVCRNDDLILINIGVESFDRNNPSKWTKKNVAVKPPVPIGQFKMADFLTKAMDR